jgi:hypothetical protein
LQRAPTIHFAITAHGFGHLTRSLALARALRALEPELEFAFSSHHPESFLRRELPFPFRYRDRSYEPGTAQFDCFRTDLERTRTSYRSFFAERPQRLAEEEQYLREIRPVGVISDIPALAIRAASNLGIPSAGVANFTWDWILEPILDGADREIVERLRSDYSSGDLHLQLPFGPDTSPFPIREAAPLVSRHSSVPADEVRARLGISRAREDDLKLVVVCPGGWEADAWEPIQVPGCAGYRFVMVGDLPIRTDAPATHLPHELPIEFRFPDLVAAADLVLAKPGYGLASECVTHQTMLIAIERLDFRETPVLLEQLGEFGPFSEISLERFLDGDWESVLASTAADRRPWSAVAEGSERSIALRLRELFAIG